MDGNRETTCTEQVQNKLILTDSTKEHLVKTSIWANFFVIIGIIGATLSISGAIFFFIFTFFIPPGENNDLFPVAIGLVTGISAIVVAYLFVMLAIYLKRFSNSLVMIAEYSDNNEVETAFSNLESIFRYCGIMVISIISMVILYVVILAIAMYSLPVDSDLIQGI